VHLGGNDINNGCDPRQLADFYLSHYSGAAPVVIFCSIVNRSQPKGVTREGFQELTTQFNQRLKDRTDGITTLYFWHHHLHQHLATDGVHLDSRGNHRLFLSFKSAIAIGLRALENKR
jgi:hypothetical protein